MDSKFTQYATVDFRDNIGNSITKSVTTFNNWNSRFDYPSDKDYLNLLQLQVVHTIFQQIEVLVTISMKQYLIAMETH